MTYIDHTHSSLLVLGDDPQSLLVDDTFGSTADSVSLGLILPDISVEQVARVVGLEPFAKKAKLVLVSRSRR